MALVAVLIACMAADIVVADAVALVAAEVSRVAAVVTIAAADETVFAADAAVGTVLAARPGTAAAWPPFSVLLLDAALLCWWPSLLALYGFLRTTPTALLDELPRTVRPDALAEPWRTAVRVLLCTGIDLPPMLIDHGELFHDYQPLTPLWLKKQGAVDPGGTARASR